MPLLQVNLDQNKSTGRSYLSLSSVTKEPLYGIQLIISEANDGGHLTIYTVKSSLLKIYPIGFYKIN